MKKLALIAALAALSACSRTEEAPAPADSTAAAETTAAAAEGTPAGTYDVKMADGTVGKTTINADGTYVDVGADGKEVRGTFARRDGKDCFDPEGDAAEECWTVGATNPDGSFTATSADGKTTVTVSPSGAGAATTAGATPAPTGT